MKRAFTLLELTLATAMAALVLAVALSMFAVSTRADKRHSERFTQDAELSRLHRAVGQAMGSLLLDELQPQPGAPAAPAPTASPEGENVRGGEGESGSRPRARILLDTDPLAGPLGPPSPTTGFPLAAAQRLELTLTRAPVRDLSGQVDILPVAIAQGAGVRGAFELRPEIDPRTGGPRLDDRGRRLSALYWTEIPPEPDPESGEAPAPPRPILIAGDIAYLRWEFFFNRERKDRHIATGVLDLPAYIILKVETARGLSADWLFEVGWTTGPDPHDPIPEEPERTEEGELPEEAGRPAAPERATPARPQRATPQRAAPQRPARPNRDSPEGTR